MSSQSLFHSKTGGLKFIPSRVQLSQTRLGRTDPRLKELNPACRCSLLGLHFGEYMELTQSRLKELLNYDSNTGFFIWAVSRRGCVPGRKAGYVRHDGYVCIRVDRRLYLAHRLAWLWINGAWPADTMDIDHANTNTSDNRICNLREATRTQNLCNVSLRSDNTSGFKGVCWCTQKKRWKARIYISGKQKHLGYHDSPEIAHAAYCAAAQVAYGDFARVA